MQVIVDIQNILREARQRAQHSINVTMVTAYWLIGKRIVEEDQEGNVRASYGTALIKTLSSSLKSEFGKGFSQRNIEQMRLFYLEYSIPQTVFAELKSANLIHSVESPTFKLSWSHYLTLISIKNIDERTFYEIESIENNWSVRELKRQYDSGLYMRLALSTDKDGIKRLSQKGQLMESSADVIKDPYILEFLDLEEHHRYSESDLENALIDKLEHFLLELGKGFTFVARQKRITFSEKHFYVDLVFYNRLLKCFVIIDLKIGEIQHQDIGQMQMYVNYYDRHIKLDEENKTIGIILCQKKSDLLVEMTLPENNDQIFASRYETVLPSKDELRQLLNSKD